MALYISSSQPVCCSNNSFSEYISHYDKYLEADHNLPRWPHRCWMLSREHQRLDHGLGNLDYIGIGFNLSLVHPSIYLSSNQ